MFVYYKGYERTGTVKNERSGTPQLSSGLKSFAAPTYLTGATRFIVSKKENKVKPHSEGRRKIIVLTTYWGWDELKRLEATGITLAPGQSKLEYAGDTYRLTDYDDFGRKYNLEYLPLGMIKAIFERESERVN